MMKCLEEVRMLLREQILGEGLTYSPSVREALLRYDSAFSEFELSYISTVIPVKSAEELQKQQEIVVLFCETVDRALKLGYLKQELIDGYEPLVMFTIPRLAIICGLLIFPDGPLNLQNGSQGMSSLFSPFYTLLVKIRDLLSILTKEELYVLEKSLCAAESSGLLCSAPPAGRSTTDCEQTRAGDCGASRRRLFRNTHTFPAPIHQSAPCENQPRPHRVGLGDEAVVVHAPPEPHVIHSPEGQSQGSIAGPPIPPPLLPLAEAAPPAVHAPSTAAGSPVAPQEDCVTGPRPAEQTVHDTGPPAPIRERFYYYRSPAEPRASSSAERTWRSRRRQSWHCGQLPPGAENTRPNMGHSAGHGSIRDLRARYSSSNDMVHRLFVCISGVADQLQTNFASDMRAILKSVFEIIVSRDDSEVRGCQTDGGRGEHCGGGHWSAAGGVRAVCRAEPG
ncbi:hypothetical protein GJAV_G00259360 [Gymnothorax javanicus]|nr:hypothetical protein GJAV_G00259360 [Gymnothorax javanicus]